MINYLLHKIFGVTVVFSLGSADKMSEHRAKHRKKVSDVSAKFRK